MKRAIIFYNIEQSNFTFSTETFTFVFSSLFNLHRFIKNYKENRENEAYKIYSRFNIDIIAVDYFDIILYSLIEKRGFKIIKKGGVVLKCLKDITLNGEIRTNKNYNV